MLKISREYDCITITGHTEPRLCSAYSSVMYTSVNMLIKYKDCIDYVDENDIVKITIKEHDKIIDMIIDNMFDMFNDIHEENESSSEIIINI